MSWRLGIWLIAQWRLFGYNIVAICDYSSWFSVPALCRKCIGKLKMRSTTKDSQVRSQAHPENHTKLLSQLLYFNKDHPSLSFNLCSSQFHWNTFPTRRVIQLQWDTFLLYRQQHICLFYCFMPRYFLSVATLAAYLKWFVLMLMG